MLPHTDLTTDLECEKTAKQSYTWKHIPSREEVHKNLALIKNSNPKKQTNME